MSNANDQLTPPSLSELMFRYVQRNEDRESLANAIAELGEVEPHDVSVGFRTEPKAAWQESTAVLSAFSINENAPAAPGEWSGMVLRAAPCAALPMAIGNYPQRVRDLARLTGNLGKELPKETSQPASRSILQWVEKVGRHSAMHRLQAAGVLRAAGDLDAAEELLTEIKATLTGELAAAADNELATILWQRGKHNEAIAAWKRLPDSVPAYFNRGMAALFLGRRDEARQCLAKPVAMLPDSSPWQHLAALYLALAEG